MPTLEQIFNTSSIRVDEDVEESRTVQFKISDSSKDRHGTILNMNNWNLENFNRNGIVGFQHDVYGGGMCKGPDPDSIIGKGRSWLEEEVVENADGTTSTEMILMGEVEFEPEEINPLAEKIFRKVLNGTLRATSVGFKPVGGGRMVNDETGEEKEMKKPPYQVPKGHTFYYEGQELLEFSIVSIPSNPNALKRDLRNQTANALHFLKRQLGDGITFGDIEEMKVKDVIRMIEKPDTEGTGEEKHQPEIKTGEMVEALRKQGYEIKEREEQAPEEGDSDHKRQHERRKRKLSIKQKKVELV